MEFGLGGVRGDRDGPRWGVTMELGCASQRGWLPRWRSSEACWVPWWCHARGEEEGTELAAVGFIGG